jgi:hypothetical protein
MTGGGVTSPVDGSWYAKGKTIWQGVNVGDMPPASLLQLADLVFFGRWVNPDNPPGFAGVQHVAAVHHCDPDGTIWIIEEGGINNNVNIANLADFAGQVLYVTRVDGVTTSPEVDMILLPKPLRAFDGPLASKTVVTLPLPIPASATGAALTLRVVQPPSGTWMYAGSPGGAPPAATEANMVSTLDFASGSITDGFPIVAVVAGKVTLYCPVALPRLVVDVTGYFGG